MLGLAFPLPSITGWNTGPIMSKYPRLLVFASCLSLVAVASIGLFSAGVPTIYCPMPTLTVLPAFVLSQWRLHVAAVLIPLVLFVAWSPGLMKNKQSKLPRRTIGLLAAFSILTAVDFSLEWKYGVEYHGLEHTVTVCLINVIWLGSFGW